MKYDFQTFCFVSFHLNIAFEWSETTRTHFRMNLSLIVVLAQWIQMENSKTLF